MTTCIHWHSVITNCRSTRNKGNEPNSLWVGRHGVQGPLRPERETKFPALVEEIANNRLQLPGVFYAKLQTIAHHCPQLLTTAHHCPAEPTITRRIVVCSWRSFTRNPDLFPFIFRHGQNRRKLGDTLGDLSPLPNIVPN